MDNRQPALKGKMKITGRLRVMTGMHIGAGNDFAPIGAVDSPFIRDMVTQTPLIPGSSIKGKMRTLLARSRSEGYILEDVDKDDEVVKRLFGDSTTGRSARLQFYDLFMTEESKAYIGGLDTDTYLGEVKFENTIGRLTGEAKPRQIERVPAGSEFKFVLVYNIESTREEVLEDIGVLRNGIDLLLMDYLGGHGTRGYGRIALSKLTVNKLLCNDVTIQTEEIEAMLND